MQIKTASRASAEAGGGRNPHLNSEDQDSGGAVHRLALLSLTLASYWASLFLNDAEAKPARDEMPPSHDPEARASAAPAASQSTHPGASAEDGALPRQAAVPALAPTDGNPGARHAPLADGELQTGRTAPPGVGPDPGAPTHSSPPPSGFSGTVDAAAANHPSDGRGQPAVGEVGPAEPPVNGATKTEPPGKEFTGVDPGPTTTLPPDGPIAEGPFPYSILDLLGDLALTTREANPAFVRTISDLAVNDWLESEAIYHQQQEPVDAAHAAFLAREHGLAEQLSNPGTREAFLGLLFGLEPEQAAAFDAPDDAGIAPAPDLPGADAYF